MKLTVEAMDNMVEENHHSILVIAANNDVSDPIYAIAVHKYILNMLSHEVASTLQHKRNRKQTCVCC